MTTPARSVLRGGACPSLRVCPRLWMCGDMCGSVVWDMSHGDMCVYVLWRQCGTYPIMLLLGLPQPKGAGNVKHVPHRWCW